MSWLPGVGLDSRKKVIRRRGSTVPRRRQSTRRCLCLSDADNFLVVRKPACYGGAGDKWSESSVCDCVWKINKRCWIERGRRAMVRRRWQALLLSWERSGLGCGTGDELAEMLAAAAARDLNRGIGLYTADCELADPLVVPPLTNGPQIFRFARYVTSQNMKLGVVLLSV